MRRLGCVGFRSAVRALYGFLLVAIAVLWVDPAGAANPIFGTVQANGPAWSATGDGKWQRIVTTRPLVAGDEFRTGEGGYMLLDMGSHGIVGLYDDTEVSAVEHGQGPSIDVSGGKLAFHIEPDSLLTISAADAEILGSTLDTASVDGYVEINDNGDAVVAVEEGELSVALDGATRTLRQGERMLLNQASLGITPRQLEPDLSSTRAPAPGSATTAPSRPQQTAAAAPQQMAAADGNGARRDKAAGITDEADDAERAAANATDEDEELLLGFTYETASVGALGAIGAGFAIEHYKDDDNGSP